MHILQTERQKLKKNYLQFSQEKTIKLRESEYEVWLKEKAIDGKANLKLFKLLKEYFGKPVKIKSGFASKNKIIEIC